MRHQRFISSPSQLPPDSFSAAFSAVAHDRGLLNSSRTAWFDACLCRPTPRGLPSSTSVAPKNRSFSPSFTSHALADLLADAGQGMRHGALRAHLLVGRQIVFDLDAREVI